MQELQKQIKLLILLFFEIDDKWICRNIATIYILTVEGNCAWGKRVALTTPAAPMINSHKNEGYA